MQMFGQNNHRIEIEGIFSLDPAKSVAQGVNIPPAGAGSGLPKLA
jgi:hypothetical protein